MIEKPPCIFVSGNVANVSPADVEPREKCESSSVGAEWLKTCQYALWEGRSDTHFLAFDAAEEEDLEQSDASTDCILVENEEGYVPAMSECVVTCES